MYKIKPKKPKKFDFDLIVIGSGPGGGVAAQLAAAEGKRVGLIESHILGGDCFVNGCLPTKALLKSALTLKTVQNAYQFGIKTSGASFNYRAVQAWKEKVLASSGIQNETKVYQSEGITIIHGAAHFLNPWVVSAGLRRYSATKFLISTGASPEIPDIPGLMSSGFITYKEAGHLLKPPRSLFIIGGGATAYEYAQIFSIFGTKVYIAEAKDHLLPKEDPEVSDSAEAALSSKGVFVCTNTKVTNVIGSPGRKIITFIWSNRQHRIAVEEVMVAVGDQPNIDIGLDNAVVDTTDNGIRVNRFMKTSAKHIFAAGDVIDINASIQAAIQEGRIAVHNMFHRRKVGINLHAVPRCFHGDPEIAVVGKTEHELKTSGELYQTAIAPIGIIGKAMTNNYSTGFVKIIATHSGILLGACIVAPYASEMLQELTYAIEHHHYACTISNTAHPFPSWNEAIRIAANKIKCI